MERWSTVAAFVAAGLALALPGCLGCLSYGHAFVVWRDPDLYEAFDGQPGWGEESQEGLPFHLATAGIPEGGAFLRTVGRSTSQVAMHLRGNVTHVTLWVSLPTADATQAEQALVGFLVETTAWGESEAADVTARLLDNLTEEHGSWTGTAPIPPDVLRLEDLYVRSGGGPLVVSAGLVGNLDFQEVGVWTFSWWVKTKQSFIYDDGGDLLGELTVFATGDAKYGFESDRATKREMARDTERMLEDRGLPSDVDATLAVWDDGCF